MKIKQLSEIKTRDEAREEAIDWQIWQADQSLSYGELVEWQNYFYDLAKNTD